MNRVQLWGLPKTRGEMGGPAPRDYGPAPEMAHVTRYTRNDKGAPVIVCPKCQQRWALPAEVFRGKGYPCGDHFIRVDDGAEFADEVSGIACPDCGSRDDFPGGASCPTCKGAL